MRFNLVPRARPAPIPAARRSLPTAAVLSERVHHGRVTTGWDGRGLPPIAEARIARFASSKLRTSLLSTPAAYSHRSVGFEPVGEVMGCIVEQISVVGYLGGAGSWGPAGYTTQVRTSDNRYFGYGPFVQAMIRGWSTSINRLREEASRLGADGVVGVTLSQHHLGEYSREFIAMGTAVRAQTSRPHTPGRPFVTEDSGADFAKLLISGWLPVDIAIGYEVATRVNDYQSRQQARMWSNTNVEVDGYTDLVQQTRDRARQKFEQAIRASGAEGGIVSNMSLHIWGQTEGLHVAEATIRGTAVVALAPRQRPAAPTPLTVLPVRATRRH
jgi:uncharacterized protein YbjQ (UPF0145 family)